MVGGLGTHQLPTRRKPILEIQTNSSSNHHRAWCGNRFSITFLCLICLMTVVVWREALLVSAFSTSQLPKLQYPPKTFSGRFQPLPGRHSSLGPRLWSEPSRNVPAEDSRNSDFPRELGVTFPTGAPPSSRTIRVERLPRLPVWPVWAGVIDFLVGWIFGAEAGSKLEQYVLGGRVCPMQFDGKTSSPFLLLVHHHHNFWKWDFLFRKLSAFVLPEGFPAHPHRGFTTLTYFLPETGTGGGGGFVHRDSMGVKQTYGSARSYEHQAQWLFTGKGILHEEMFDFSPKKSYDSRYELYQLWVNVPSFHKLDPPEVQLLQTTDSKAEEPGAMPRVCTTTSSGRVTTSCEVVVLAGSYRPHGNSGEGGVSRSQAAPLHSDLSVLHVAIEEEEQIAAASSNDQDSPATAGWIYDIPSGHETLIVYVRKGSCTMQTTTDTRASASSSSPLTEVPMHSTVFVESPSGPWPTTMQERLVVRPQQPGEVVDLLVLSGRPLEEPVAMQGSMVMNDAYEIERAYRDYQSGQMGVPWDHKLGDGDWREHVERTQPRR